MDFKQSILVLCCGSALFLSACNNDDKDLQAPPGFNQFVSIGKYNAGPILKNAQSVEVMSYSMENVQGQSALTSAMVFMPKTPKPKDGWRVVVWDHGTVGVADQCAPSQKPLGENFSVLAEKLLEKGYIVLAPDYEGLGSKGIHPYLNLRSEAKSTLAAVAAYKQQYGKQLHGAWMSVGQSQGGQASLGTAEYANQDQTYKGAVAAAPANSLGLIIIEDAPKNLAMFEQMEQAQGVPLNQRASITAQATLNAYAALTGLGIKAYAPKFDYLALFHPQSMKLAQLGEGSNGEDGLCLNDADPQKSLVSRFKQDIVTYLTQNPDKKLADYPGVNADVFAHDQTVQQFLKDSQPGTKRIDKPVLVIQGQMDSSVPERRTEQVVNTLRNLGSKNIQYEVVPGASHTQAIMERHDMLIQFIERHMPVS